MPIYEVIEPESGQRFKLEGDSPPTEAELEDIFKSQIDSGIGRLRSYKRGAVEGFVRGIGQSLKGIPQQAAALHSGMAAEYVEPTPEEAKAKEEERARLEEWAHQTAIYKAGENLVKASEDPIRAPNPRYKDEFLSEVAEGVGSTAASAFTAAAGTAIGGPVVGVGLGGLQYGLSSGQDEYERAIQHGATLQQADAVGAANMVIGAGSEALLGAGARIMRLGERGITKRLLGETYEEWAKKRPIRGTAIEGTVGETLQEGTEQIGQNVARLTYDPDQEIFEDVPKAALLGGTIGLLFGGSKGLLDHVTKERTKDVVQENAGTLPGTAATVAGMQNTTSRAQAQQPPPATPVTPTGATGATGTGTITRTPAQQAEYDLRQARLRRLHRALRASKPIAGVPETAIKGLRGMQFPTVKALDEYLGKNPDVESTIFTDQFGKGEAPIDPESDTVIPDIDTMVQAAIEQRNKRRTETGDKSHPVSLAWIQRRFKAPFATAVQVAEKVKELDAATDQQNENQIKAAIDAIRANPTQDVVMSIVLGVTGQDTKRTFELVDELIKRGVVRQIPGAIGQYEIIPTTTEPTTTGGQDAVQEPGPGKDVLREEGEGGGEGVGLPGVVEGKPTIPGSAEEGAEEVEEDEAEGEQTPTQAYAQWLKDQEKPPPPVLKDQIPPATKEEKEKWYADAQRLGVADRIEQELYNNTGYKAFVEWEQAFAAHLGVHLLDVMHMVFGVEHARKIPGPFADKEAFAGWKEQRKEQFDEENRQSLAKDNEAAKKATEKLNAEIAARKKADIIAKFLDSDQYSSREKEEMLAMAGFNEAEVKILEGDRNGETWDGDDLLGALKGKDLGSIDVSKLALPESVPSDLGERIEKLLIEGKSEPDIAAGIAKELGTHRANAYKLVIKIADERGIPRTHQKKTFAKWLASKKPKATPDDEVAKNAQNETEIRQSRILNLRYKIDEQRRLLESMGDRASEREKAALNDMLDEVISLQDPNFKSLTDTEISLARQISDILRRQTQQVKRNTIPEIIHDIRMLGVPEDVARSLAVRFGDFEAAAWATPYSIANILRDPTAAVAAYKKQTQDIPADQPNPQPKSDVSAWLGAPEVDPKEAERVERIKKANAEIREGLVKRAQELDKEKKILSPIVHGRHGRMKKTAKKADKQRWSVLQQESYKLEQDIQAFDKARSGDNKASERIYAARVANDPAHTPLARLTARAELYRLNGEDVPADLQAHIDAEELKIIRTKIPDITTEEYKKVRGLLAYSNFKNDSDPTREMEFDSRFRIYEARADKLKRHLHDNAWNKTAPGVPKELQDEIDEYITDYREYNDPRPVNKLSTDTLNALIRRIDDAIPKIRKLADKQRAEDVAAAEESHKRRMMRGLLVFLGLTEPAETHPGGERPKPTKAELPAGPLPVTHVKPEKRKVITDPLTILEDIVTQDETRYVLTGVYISKVGDEKFAIATDGRMLVQIPYKGPLKEGVIYATGPKNKGEKRGKSVDGQFPNYAQVIPKGDPDTKIPITDTMLARLNGLVKANRRLDLKKESMGVFVGLPNGTLIDPAKLHDVVEALRRAGYTDLVIGLGEDSLTPITVYSAKDKTAKGVIMPVRGNRKADTKKGEATSIKDLTEGGDVFVDLTSTEETNPDVQAAVKVAEAEKEQKFQIYLGNVPEGEEKVSVNDLPKGILPVTHETPPKVTVTDDPIVSLADVVTTDPVRSNISGVGITSGDKGKVVYASDGKVLVRIPYKGDLEDGSYGTGPLHNDKPGKKLDIVTPSFAQAIPTFETAYSTEANSTFVSRLFGLIKANERLENRHDAAKMVMAAFKNGQLFDPKQLWKAIDALRKAGHTDLVLEFQSRTGHDNPVRIVSKSDPNVVAAVMPMRLTNEKGEPYALADNLYSAIKGDARIVDMQSADQGKKTTAKADAAVEPTLEKVEEKKPSLINTENLSQSEVDEFEKLRKAMGDKLSEGGLPGAKYAVQPTGKPAIDSEFIVMGARMAQIAIKAGAVKFSRYAKTMIGALGEKAKIYLLSWYENARLHPSIDPTALSTVKEAEEEYEREYNPQRIASGRDVGEESGTTGGRVTHRARVVREELIPQPNPYVGDGSYAAKSGFTLTPHQTHGINAIMTWFDRHPDGGAFVLGDGTGFGKSAQMIGVIDQYRKKHPGARILLVTPSLQILKGSLTDNANRMDVDIGPVVKSSYKGLADLKGEEFDLALFDEAHNLKNGDAQKSVAAALLKVKHRVFATATPMDKPTGAAYFLSEITREDPNIVADKLGYGLADREDKETRKIYTVSVLKPGFSWASVWANIIAYRDAAIGAGAMLRRDYPFFGQVSEEEIVDWDRAVEVRIKAHFDNLIRGSSSPTARKNYAGQKTLTLSRWSEQSKVQRAFDLAMAHIQKGGQAVIMAETDKDQSFPIRLEGAREGTNERGQPRWFAPGAITQLTKLFEDAGITVSHIHDTRKNVVAAEVSKFQKGLAQVALATPQSGGAGINLDDFSGDKPRLLIVLSKALAGDVFDQVLGRVSRATTQSMAVVRFLSLQGGYSDGRRTDILNSKMRTLLAIQGGMDLDAAGGFQIRQEGTQAETDVILDVLNKLIDKTNPHGGQVFDALAGIPMAVIHVALKTARLVYLSTKSLAQAVEAAVQFVKSKIPIEDFDEAATRAYFEKELKPIAGAANRPGGGTGEPKRSQVFGRKGVGHEYNTRNVQETIQGVRNDIFDGTREISPEATAAAFRLARARTNPETAEETSREIRAAGGNEMAGTITDGELFNYAVRLAATGSTDLVNYLLAHINVWQDTLSGDGASSHGAALRGRREFSNPLWKVYEQYGKERDKAAAGGVGQDVVDRLKREMEGLRLTIQQLEDALAKAGAGTGTGSGGTGTGGTGTGTGTGGTGTGTGTGAGGVFGGMEGESDVKVDDPLFYLMLQQALESGKTRLTPMPGDQDVLQRIKDLFPKMGMRRFLEKYGGEDLAKKWWALLAAAGGGKPPPGPPLSSADKALQTELGNLLREAMERLGLIGPKKKGIPDDATKLAQILGKDELRQGKVREVDRLVEEELDRRHQAETDAVNAQENLEAEEMEEQIEIINEKYEQLTEKWNEVMGSMAADPASRGFFRRMIHNAAKKAGIKWPEVLKDKTVHDAARDQVVGNIIREVQAASSAETFPGRGHTPLDLNKATAALRSVFDQVVETKRRKAELSATKARERAAKYAAEEPERTAKSILDKLAQSQSDVLSWPTPKKNAVREIVRDALKVKAPFRGAENLWRQALTNRLIAAGVSPETAETLTNAAWRERTLRTGVREMQAAEAIATRGSLRPLMREILDAPLEMQQSREWRMGTAIRFFKQRGMSTERAQTAARVFNDTYDKRMQEAREKLATDLLEKSEPWQTNARSTSRGKRRLAHRQLEAIRHAVRASLTDPTGAGLNALAGVHGWSGFTPEQHTRLAQLDSILNTQGTPVYEASRATGEMMRIAASVKLPQTSWNIIAASFTNSALSSLGTFSVNIFAPPGELAGRYVSSMASHIIPGHGGIPAMIQTTKSFLKALSNWIPEFWWSLKNDIYSKRHLLTLEHIAHLHNAMEKNWERIKNGTPKQKAVGLFNAWYASTDLVRRILQSLDQAWMATSEQFSREFYAGEVLRQLGKDADSMTRLTQAANAVSLKAYEEAKANGATNMDALMAARAAMSDAFYMNLNEWIGPDLGQKVRESAELDAELIVGLKEDMTEDNEGLISQYTLVPVIEQVRKLRSKGGMNAVAATALYGFVGVPGRIMRNGLYWTPYGTFRWAMRHWGKTNHWQQSMSTDLQARQRLIQSILGTAFVAGLLMLRKSTADEDDDDDFAIYFSGYGPGPSDRGYRDAWLKKHKPYSVELKIGGLRVHLPYGRGVGEFVLWPLAALGAIDDYELKKGHTLDPTKEVNAGWEWAFSFVHTMAQRGAFFGLKNLSRTVQFKDTSIADQITWAISPIIPWSGFMKSVERIFSDLPDKTSVKGAVFANLPIFHSMGTRPALNALGDPINDTTIPGKAWFAGLPFLFRIPDTDNNRDIYALILEKQQAPPTPNRPQTERKYGAMTDDQWYNYVKVRGGETKRLMLERYADLKRMDAVEFDATVTKYSQDGDAKAARDLKLTAIRRGKAAAAMVPFR